MTDIVIAVLGAGRAERFGGGKLDALLHGRPLGQWALQAALGLGARVVWVAGAAVPEFLRAHPSPVTILHNVEGAGMGTSIALAANHASQQGAAQMLLMLADMPFVGEASLRELIATAQEHGASACLYPDGTMGAPACFAAQHFAVLALLEGDMGARKLLSGAISAKGIAVPPSELRDIDTLGDLKTAQNAL